MSQTKHDPAAFRRAAAAIDALVNDPRSGLPDEIFLLVSRLTPMVNVDLLIRDDDGRTLLTWRPAECGDPAGWHVPGGIIRYKEKAADRVRAVAKLELGANVAFSERPLAVNEAIRAVSENRGHFISLLFDCTLLTPPEERLRYRGSDPEPGQWAWHSVCPNNLVPVQEMYRRYL